MSRKCNALLHNCPTCKIRIPDNERKETCPECGADLHCDNFVVPGYDYCSHHGGPSPSHGYFGKGRAPLSGKESSFQLTRMAAKYNEVQADGRILSNRKAMDIIWTRVQQLAERIDMNEAPERMAVIQKLWADFRDKSKNGREVEAVLVAKRIDEEFEAAYHDYMAWKQMFEALELHSKMTESEVKILKDLRAIMTVEDGMEMMAKVMSVLLRVLQDNPKKLKEVQYELARIVDAKLDTRIRVGSGEVGVDARPDFLDREGILYPGDEE